MTTKKFKDILEDLWYTFRYSKVYDVYTSIRNFPSNVKLLIDYIPIIWGNYDWDHSYFVNLMIFKLLRMEKFFRGKNAWALNSLFYANEIKFTIECLKDSQEFDLDYLHRKHTEKYGEIKFWSTPTDNPNYMECHSRYTKCTTPEMEEQASKEVLRIYRLEEQIMKESHDMAFDMIKENLTKWWD